MAKGRVLVVDDAEEIADLDLSLPDVDGVHVSNLRKKVTAAGAPPVIATVRGVGYRLAPDLVFKAGS